MTQRFARLALGTIAGSLLVALAPAGCAVAVTAKMNPPALWYKIAGDITDADAIAAASRYRTVILQSWQLTAARTIKAHNPAVTVLAYKDLSSASYAEAALYNERNGLPMATGVGYLDATAHGWLAKDTNGQPVGWKGYPNLWQMEVWNPGYQQRWVDNVTREMNGSIFDGVFGDDALTTLKYYSSATLAEAPTDAALQAGEEALISKATTALHAMGKKIVVNISGSTDNLPVWTRWSQMTDGAMLEHYAHWGSDPNNPANYLYDWGSRGWTAGIQALATSPGNVAVTTSADTDDRSYRYGLASFLLATGGHGAFTAVDSYKKAPFRPEQSWDLGYATAPMVKTGAAYSRVFPNGFAAVNPSKDQTVTLALPAPLQDVSGATVTSVTLPPLTGALFKGAVTSTPTTSPSGKLRSIKPKPFTTSGTSGSSGTSSTSGNTGSSRNAGQVVAHATVASATKSRATAATREAAASAVTSGAGGFGGVNGTGLAGAGAGAGAAGAGAAGAGAGAGAGMTSGAGAGMDGPAGVIARGAMVAYATISAAVAGHAADRAADRAADSGLAMMLALASGTWFFRRRRATGSTSRSS